MSFDARFLDDVKHRTTLSDIVGRTVKLVRRGREHTGLCPFHSEKSPSFTLNDQKGFYHCFGCGAHGSVFDFVMNTEGLSFPEAVERLAQQAGLSVPKPDPQATARAEKRQTLSDVMESVTRWYEAQLRTPAGGNAYRYVRARGLSEDTLKRYGLGYAPSGRTVLKDAMLARGVKEQQLIELGMLIKPEDGSESYDRFRDRVMFPIGDRQGRVIAFGGRALNVDAKAKYLNSPETPLFHKGATLYNWAPARKAAFDGGEILVVEGYMDVIALGQVGIDHAVAPLGTALTEEQISHLWQMADEPILAFDGDKAGVRAAYRAAERALPMLRAGKSLRFLMLPEGDDPDSLVQREGRAALDRLTDGADPLVDILWGMLTGGINVDTPERKAGLEKKVFMELSRIQDEGIKSLYQKEFRSRLWALGRQSKPLVATQGARRQKRAIGVHGGYASGAKGYGGQGQRMSGAGFGSKAGYPAFAASTGLLKQTALGRQSGPAPYLDMLEKLMLLTLTHHPEILVRHGDALADIDVKAEKLRILQSSLLFWLSGSETLDEETLKGHLERSGLSGFVTDLERECPKRTHWPAHSEAALSDALTYFEHVLARYRFATAVQRDYEQAKAECAAHMTDENYARLLAAQRAFQEMEEKHASIEGFGLESNRNHGSY